MVSFTNSTRVIRAPGKVISTPTDLADAAGTGEYGGTIIGSIKLVVLVPLGRPYVVECEGRGEASDILEANKKYVVHLFLRGWDKSAVLSLLAGGYAAGATTGNAVWTEPGSKTPGQSATGRALTWLFAPDDTHNHPALIIRAGIPDFTDGAEIAFQRGEEFGLSMSIECLRNATNQILDLGHLADLTL